jgi:predicted Fe-Mo cluster-binding NifX family protein
MKIAIVSDDEQTISRHFGRAKNYVVVSIENEKVVTRKTLPKPDLCCTNSRRHGRHRHGSVHEGKGFGPHANDAHEQMFKNIWDCDILVTRGMGQGAYLDLQQLGVKTILTDITDIDTAIDAMLDDTIINHTELLH